MLNSFVAGDSLSIVQKVRCRHAVQINKTRQKSEATIAHDSSACPSANLRYRRQPQPCAGRCAAGMLCKATIHSRTQRRRLHMTRPPVRPPIFVAGGDLSLVQKVCRRHAVQSNDTQQNSEATIAQDSSACPSANLRCRRQPQPCAEGVPPACCAKQRYSAELRGDDCTRLVRLSVRQS